MPRVWSSRTRRFLRAERYARGPSSIATQRRANLKPRVPQPLSDPSSRYACRCFLPDRAGIGSTGHFPLRMNGPRQVAWC